MERLPIYSVSLYWPENPQGQEGGRHLVKWLSWQVPEKTDWVGRSLHSIHSWLDQEFLPLILGMEETNMEAERSGPSVRLWLAMLCYESWDAELVSQQKECTTRQIHRKRQRWEMKILQGCPTEFPIWVSRFLEAHSYPQSFMIIII